MERSKWRNEEGHCYRKNCGSALFGKETANGGYRNISITNHQLVFERRTGQERILIAINASESDFTIHHGELLGTFTDLLKSGSGNISQTLNGSLDLPAYSVQYLKEIS